MTSRDFAYWLMGLFELGTPQEGLSPEQTAKIKAHLDMVFLHEIDPSYGNKEKQRQLADLHRGPSTSTRDLVMKC